MALTGVAFALAEDFWPLLLIAFVGTLNPSAGDVSLFLPLEQARLPARRRRPRPHRALRPLQPGRLARRRHRRVVRRVPGGAGWLLPGGLERGAQGRVPALRRARAGRPAPLPPPPRRRPPSAAAAPAEPLRRSRAASSSPWQRSSASMPSPAASWCSRCWRCGCSSASASRWPRPGRSSSGPGCSRRCPTSCRRADRPADRARQHDGVHAPAGEPLPRPRALRAEPRPGDRAAARRAARSRRWTCRPAPPT